MRRTPILLGLLSAVVIAVGGCWPLEEEPAPMPTPQATATPPIVEQAGLQSPAIAGRLLYAREGHIWMRTGTTAHRLTEYGPATQPAWSPDGQQIVFVVKGDGYSDLWIMAADGGNAHPITNNRSAQPPHSWEAVHSSFWAAEPQWIPPLGEWLGYLSHNTPQAAVSRMAIWILRPDGTEDQRYLAWSGNIENPAWSPDGRYVAFAAYPDYPNNAQPRLLYYDVESNAILPLGEQPEDVQRYDPAWSPDGLWLAYAARQGRQTDIWLMPSPPNHLFAADWSPVRLTTKGTARAPAWSPTGRQLAFIALENDSFDLWLLDLDTGGEIPQAVSVQKLTDGDRIDATARPSWAP